MALELTPELLVEIHRIERLKYAYLRCLDRKEWDELRTLFLPHATASYGGGAKEITGGDAIVDWLEETMGDAAFHSAHRCTQPEIDFDDESHAFGRWALVDWVIDTRWDICVQGASFYEDRYEQVDGQWRLAHTGYLRTYEEIYPRGSVEGLRLTASFSETAGRSTLL